METLIITAIASDQALLLTQLCAFASKYNGNIEYSNMAAFGNESVLTLSISGQWNTIARLEAAMPTLEKSLGSPVLYKRMIVEKNTDALLPYIVNVVALNHPGLLQEITEFFAEQDIIIHSLETQIETIQNSSARLFSLTMKILIPGDLSISEMRDQFMLLCDDFNVDGAIEPEKFR
jgi:glycine cleavage system transcriptional repressor